MANEGQVKIGIRRFSADSGVSTLTIQNWIKKGLFDRDAKKKFYPHVAIRQIFERSARKVPSSTADKLRAYVAKFNLPVEIPADEVVYSNLVPTQAKTLAQEQLRLARAKADQAEIKAAEMAGGLVDMAAATAAWRDSYVKIRTRLRSIARDLAGDLAIADNARDCEILVQRAITEALEELSERPPDIKG